MRRSERLAESFVDEVFHRVTREVVEYAESVESSVVVLEDLTYIGESMDDGGFMNWRLHGCGFGKLHVQIRYGTVQGCPKGVRVETVTLHNTSKEGYACGELGYPPRQATFEWTSNACWVGKY